MTVQGSIYIHFFFDVTEIEAALCNFHQGSKSFRWGSLPSRHPRLEDVVVDAVVDEVGVPLLALKTAPVLLLLPSKIFEMRGSAGA